MCFEGKSAILESGGIELSKLDTQVSHRHLMLSVMHQSNMYTNYS